MTKEEKIKEAYGEHYPQLSDSIDENGWSSNWNHFASLETRLFAKEDIEKSNGKWRLKSLQGIENNNGWTKIETKEGLPEFGYYEVVVRSNGKMTRATLDKNVPLVYYSHYQTISDLKPPLH